MEISKTKKITYGYLFKFMNAPISWCTKKQPVVSTCESDFIVSYLAACHAIWLDYGLKEMNIEVCKPIAFLIDKKICHRFS